jgi:hypothetical protein
MVGGHRAESVRLIAAGVGRGLFLDGFFEQRATRLVSVACVAPLLPPITRAQTEAERTRKLK